MHSVIAGVGKRLFLCIFDSRFKKRKFYLNKKKKGILNLRIANFGGIKEFKRFPRSLEFVAKWKSNEYFQWLFYLAPLCLTHLIDRLTYSHYLCLVFVVSKLWDGPISTALIDLCKDLIDSFLNNLEDTYDSIY